MLVIDDLESVTSSPFYRYTDRIKDGLYSEGKLHACVCLPSHMNAKAVPVGIEYFMSHEERRGACAGRAREEFKEWGQVFGANMLCGERGVAESMGVWCSQYREIASRRESTRRGGCDLSIHPIERCTEEASQRVLRVFPALIDTGQR